MHEFVGRCTDAHVGCCAVRCALAALDSETGDLTRFEGGGLGVADGRRHFGTNYIGSRCLQTCIPTPYDRLYISLHICTLLRLA
jgi:hypothetical protein